MPFESVDLYELAEDIILHLNSVASKKNIQLQLDGHSVSVEGVRQVLYEMIYNLCDNAIKYNRRDGEVEVTVSRGRNGRAVVSVADTGIGIAKEDQERIFERFYRVDKSRSKQRGGTGLGLSIVKHIVDCHNGTISLRSELGHGTEITILLPAK